MPNPMLLNLASKTGVSLEFLEDKWEDAKKVTAEDFGVHIFDFGQKEFDYAKDILMSMINESEQQKKDKIKIFEEFLEYPKKSKDFINESTDLKEFASLDGYKDGYAGRPIDKNYPADTNVEKQEYMLAYQRGKEDREKGTQTFVGAFAESESLKEEITEIFEPKKLNKDTWEVSYIKNGKKDSFGFSSYEEANKEYNYWKKQISKKNEFVLKEEPQSPSPSVNDTYEDFKNWYMAQGIKQTELDPEVLAQLKQREDAQVSTSLGNISDSPTGIKKDKDFEVKESVGKQINLIVYNPDKNKEYDTWHYCKTCSEPFKHDQLQYHKDHVVDGYGILNFPTSQSSVRIEEEQEIKKQLSIYKRSDGKYGFIGPILLGDEELQDGYKDYQDALDAMKAKGYKLFENVIPYKKGDKVKFNVGNGLQSGTVQNINTDGNYLTVIPLNGPQTFMKVDIDDLREPRLVVKESLILSEVDSSLKAPKEWWDEKIKDIEGDDPSAVLGKIWADLSDAKKAEIRGRYGKTYGPANESISLSQAILQAKKELYPDKFYHLLSDVENMEIGMRARDIMKNENKTDEAIDGNIVATSDVPYYSKETQEVIENILKEETPEDKTDEAVDGNVMAVSDVPYYTNGEKVEEANKVGQKVKISYQGKTGEAEGIIKKENSNGSYEIKITTDNDPYDKKGTMVTLYPEEFELKEDINDSISRFKKAYPKESKGMTDEEIIDYIKDLKKTGKELDKPFKKFGLGEDQTPPFRSIDTEDDNPRVVPDKEENKEIQEKK